MTPEEKVRSLWGGNPMPANVEAVMRAAITLAYEDAAKIAEKRRDTWRAEADTYSEDNQVKFVRNIRAGEAQAIAAAIRSRTSEGT